MKVARERVRFVPLLAGNLVAVAILVIAFCAQFSGDVPLWLLQAPYFATGGVIVLALTPLERLLLDRLRRHIAHILVEAIAAATASTLLGIPGGLIIGTIAAVDPRSFVGPDLNGLGTYMLVGGLFVGAACFACTLAGRLLSVVLGRAPWAPPVVISAAALNGGVAIVYLATI